VLTFDPASDREADPTVVPRQRPGWPMGHMPNEADLTPPGGRPMREVRLTPWVPIRKHWSRPDRGPYARPGRVHANRINLWLRLALFVRRPGRL